MNRSHRPFVFAVAMTLMLSSRLLAAGVLDYIPPDALGYAVVNDLSATNAKLEKVMTLFEGAFEVLPPGPLTLIKASTGIGAGLNDSGDALIVMLPGSAGAADARPMFLAPVSDYAAFAASVSGDGTGAISRVAIMGEEVLIAKKDDYVLVMNVENRPTMEGLLAESPAQPAEVQALAEWAAGSDAAVVLLPPGIDAVNEMGQAGLDADTERMREQFGESEDLLASAKSVNDMYKGILSYLGAEVASGGVGLSIDDATNIRITHRLAFKQESRLAEEPAIEKPGEASLSAYPAAAFVYGGGGPLPTGWPDSISRLAREVIQASPEIYGFEDFEEADWKKLEQSWKEGLVAREFSMAMLVGEQDDPLYSNIYFTVEVPDATEYLKAMRRSIELWNELTAKSTSDIKLEYEIADAEIAGKEAMLMTVDAAAAAADEAVPMVRPLMEAMFGSDGKVRFYVVAADDDTVVMAIAPEVQTGKAVVAALNRDAGLDQSAEVQATTTLLNPQAPWTWYISPPGLVGWVGRFMSNAMAKLGGMAFTIPEYPAGPPVGFSAALADGQFQAEIVAPAQVLKDLGDYIETCKGM